MNDSVHRLLRRQLARVFGNSFEPGELTVREQQLVDIVSQTYGDADTERRFHEHILELSSTELGQKNHALKRALRSLADAQRLARIGSWTLHVDVDDLEWSDALYRILELQPGEVAASFDLLRSLIHPEDLELADAGLVETLARHSFEATYRLALPGRAPKIIHEHREVIEQAGTALIVQGTIQDVTGQKLVEKELRLYADVFRSSGEAILITDRDNRVVAVNKAFTSITGYTIDDLRGRDPKMLSSGGTPRETYAQMWHSLRTDGYWKGELVDRRKDGSTYPKGISIAVSRDDDGSITNYVASFSDISEAKAAQQRVHFLAHHDALTGLPNRFSFEERFTQSLNMADRHGRHVALMFIDMDRFKLVNDTLGHQAGDALLVEVARRLRTHVRESDIVARIGGDEFVVVLTELADDLLAAPLARVLLHALCAPYMLEGREIYSSPSIGISVFPNDGREAAALIRNADTAMYHAKAQGRNNSQFFTAEMNASAGERLRIESELRVALDSGQFELRYQLKVCGDTLAPSGFEALLRWRHPQRGLMSPDEFIPILEESKLIVPVGCWVLEEACRQHLEWRRRHGVRVSIAVNLSAQQLKMAALTELIRDLLEKYEMKGDDLEIEITESAAMDEPDAAIRVLNGIRAIGVELAIDDFGTGYSSLSYLNLLPIQTLKLDRAFVHEVEQEGNNAKIATATLALAHSLGLKVVAEGVETVDQRDFLRRCGCDYLQGYLFGKPLPADEAIQEVTRVRVG